MTPAPVTFLVEPLLLIQDDQLAVLVSLLQHVLALFDVAVIVLQTQQGGHQGHVRLQERQDFSRNYFLGRPFLPQPRPASGWNTRHATQARKSKQPFPGLQVGAFIAFMLSHTTFCKRVGVGEGEEGKEGKFSLGNCPYSPCSINPSLGREDQPFWVNNSS